MGTEQKMRIAVVGQGPEAEAAAKHYRAVGAEVECAGPGLPSDLAGIAAVHLAGLVPGTLERLQPGLAAGLTVVLELPLRLSEQELGAFLVACARAGTVVLLAHAALVLEPMLRLRHLASTGIAGALRRVVVYVSGDREALVRDLGQAGGSPAIEAMACVVSLLDRSVAWRAGSPGGDPPDPSVTLYGAVEDGPEVRVVAGRDRGYRLIAEGRESTLGLEVDGPTQRVWATRNQTTRELCRADVPAPDRAAVAATMRTLAGRSRHAATGHTALLVLRTLESARMALGALPTLSPPAAVPTVPGLLPRPPSHLDVYLKLPLSWRGTGPVEQPYWEAKFNVERRCNQDCIFCFARSADLVFTDPVECPFAADGLRAQGVAGVVFSGGEPTLNPSLPEYIAQSRTAGLEFVTVETNAVRFSSRDQVARCRDAGMDAAFVSFHTAQPALSEQLTQTRGTFEKTVAGIGNLLAAGVAVHLNCVTNRLNYRFLEETARFVAAEFPQAATATFSFIAPLGRAFNRADLIPTISEAAPYLRDALLAAEAAGLCASVPGRCGIPLCFLPGLERFFVEYRLREHLDAAGPRQLEDRVKTELCPACRLDRYCQGLWRNYATLYGSEELRRQFGLVNPET